MLKVLPTSVNKIFVHTGNILSLNEIKKLAGHNQTDEFERLKNDEQKTLVESLRITLSDWKPKDVVQLPGPDTTTVEVTRNDKANSHSEELDRDNLKVTVKVFVSAPRKEILREALDNVFSSLNVNKIDSLVLACKLEPSAVLSGLQNMWSVIEELAEEKRFEDVGVSDIDTDVFVSLFNWAKVKPTIIQINLAVCCVVPPVLQEFCKNNNVQLLTHSDPLEILPKPALYQLFGAKDMDDLTLNWALRFQIHVKCRGVLSSKGYLVCVSRPKEYASK